MRYFFLAVEIMIFVIFLIPVFSGILNPGNVAGMLASAGFAVLTIFFDKFKLLCSRLFECTSGRILIISVFTLAAAAVVYIFAVSSLMLHAQLNSPGNAKAVIVLGCKVKGDQPSRMLARRLDSAFDFLIDNEDAICIVSGGKGDDEKISEALAMKNYLTEKGIDPERIIMEDKSRSTYENFKYSAEILNQWNISEAAVVTDGFHQYRAGIIAKKFDIKTSAVNAKTDSYTKWFIPTYWVREWMAVANEFFKTVF
ncbi:MAG: YdcF family protein [Porcipelethomonas sp.]